MAFLPAASLSREDRKLRTAGAPIATGELDPVKLEQQAQQVASVREQQAQIQLNDTPLDEPAGASTDFTRTVRNQQGGTGSLTTQGEFTTDTPEQVQDALSGVEARSDVRVQNIIAQQERTAQGQAPTTASQIQELEAQLSTPGRGLRQSFGDLLTETQGRKSARKQLDKLYAQQKTETTQAGQNLRAGVTGARAQRNADRSNNLAERRFQQTKEVADQASNRRAFEDARTVHTNFAKEKYKDDPDKQQAYVAKQLAAKDPNFLTTPEGQGYTRQIKGDVVEAIRGERGLFDAIFGDKAPTQGDIESFSFKGWKIGDAGPWFGDPTVAKKGQSGNYAYLDNLSDEQVWVLEQLIRQDNPEDYPNAKREGIRTGQR